MGKRGYFSDQKKKLRNIVYAFLCFLLVFSIIFFLRSLMTYNESLEKRAEKEEYIAQLKDDVQQLQYIVNSPLDDEFKIRIAREKLGMCFPDEIIFYGEYRNGGS